MNIFRPLLRNRLPGSSLRGAALLAAVLLWSRVAPVTALPDAADQVAQHLRPAGGSPTSGAAVARFGDIYVTGMAVLLPGGGTLEPPGAASKVSAKTLRSELLIPSGSLVTTGASETARVRLGERSLLRISPDSAVRIFALHLKLERGEIGVQQGKTILPLRILASDSAMIVDCESAADFFLSKAGSMIVTVQAGTARLQGREERFSAGQRIEVAGSAAVSDPPVSHLLEWLDSPRFAPWQETMSRLDMDVSEDTFNPAETPAGAAPGAPAVSGPESAGQTASTTGSTLPGSFPQAPDDVLQQHDLDGAGQP